MKTIMKKLLKTAKQILKIGECKTVASSENFIGTGYFAIKKGSIKILDSAIEKEEAKVLPYERLVPECINDDYEIVENIEVRKTYTQLLSKSITAYLNTSYYIFFNNHIKDMKLYVKNAVDPIIMTNKNDEVLGIILPVKMKNDIVLKGSGIIDSDIIDIDNPHIYINVESLNYEEKEKLKDLGFKRFSRGRYIKVFSHNILRNLGFSLSHEVFENDITLTELKEELRQKEIKKEIEQKMIIESYEELLPFYQNAINDLINDGYKIEGLNIKLSPKKTCYYFYIDTDEKEFNFGFICNKGNLDLNKTQQKALFKMLKDNLVLEDKINDLSEDIKIEKVKEYKNNIENIETLKDHIVIKHKEIKDLFFNNSTDAIFNIELDKLLSNMLIDEIKLRNKKGYRLEAYINDNKYIDFINSIINILKSKDDLKTFDNYSYQELMSIMNDLKYDDKLIKKYNNKFIKLKEDIKEEFYVNELAAGEEFKHKSTDPGTNINCLYSVTHENDIEKIDIIPSNNLNEVRMSLQLLAAEKVKSINLRPIYNDDIEGHKEYQIEQLKLYNSNTLKFQKKRITHKMIEQYTKYFIYDNKTFMAVKPSKDGIYPTGYYQHVKQYDSLVDIDNKIILFRDHGTLESLEEVQNV